MAVKTDEPTISILIPAYNEHATIGLVLTKLLALPLNLREILVVDDGSSDGTHLVVQRFAAEDERVRYLKQPKNQGKTAAIRVALAAAQGDILLIQDADLEYDPADIPDLVAPILEAKADVVYGSRFLVKRAARVLYFYHYLANKSLTFLSNLLTNRNMSDIETCYKAFRAEVIKPLQLTSSGFGLEVEITAMICRTAARTFEVPISYYGRTYDEGKKIGLADGIAALWYIVYYNLVAPYSRRGKQYVRTVNAALRDTASREVPTEPSESPPSPVPSRSHSG
jgi:glycosyltransferase involved in cell wall biosynthesis